MPSARAFEWQNSGIWDSDSVDRAFDRAFDSGPSWFTAGPSWMMNAMPGSRFRARVLDRSAEIQQSTVETPYVGTLHDIFDVNLFSNVSGFASSSASAAKLSQPVIQDTGGGPNGPLADTTTSAWSGATSTTWSTPGNWGVNGVPSTTVSALFNSTFSNQPTLTAGSTSQGIWLATGTAQDVTIGAASAQTLAITGTATLNTLTNTGILLDDTANHNLTIDTNVATTVSNNTSFLVNDAATLTIKGGLNLGTKTLTLGGTNASGKIVISGNIANTAGKITVTTLGNVTLSGTNAFSAGLTLTSGTTTGTNSTALGTGLITINGSGVTLNLRNDADTTFTNNGLTLTSGATGTITLNADQATGAGTNHTLTLGGTLTLNQGRTLNITTGNGYIVGFGATSPVGASAGNATITLAGAGNATFASLTGSSTAATTSTINFNGSGTSTITGNITDNTGAFSLSKGSAAGVLILQGTGSNYTGSTTISNGTIRTAVATNGFGNTSGISVGGSGILDLRNDSSVAFSNGTTNYPVSTTANGATINVDNNNSAVTNQTLTIGTLNVSGSTPTVNITGGHSYTLATGTVTLATTGNTAVTFNPTTGSVNLASVTSGANNINLILDGTSSGNSVGAITTGTGTLTKSNTSTWTLSGNSNYSGGTTVSAGLLYLNSSTALGSSSGSLTVNGGILDLNGQNISVGNLTGSGGTIWNNGPNAGSSTVTLTIGTNNTGGGTYAGVITDNNGAAPSAKVALTKNGSGIIILSGANTYTGTTIVNGGTLQLDNAGSSTPRLAGTSGITVNSGGTLLLSSSSGTSTNRINDSATLSLNGGTFNTGGLSERGGTLAAPTAGLGALTLTATSTIDFGSGTTSIIEFGGVGTHTLGTTLNITNWDGTPTTGGGTERLLFAGVATDFTTQYLTNDVTFNGVAGYTVDQFTGFYEVTVLAPVPEPSTWIGAALALGAIGVMGRGRFRKKLKA